MSARAGPERVAPIGSTFVHDLRLAMLEDLEPGLVAACRYAVLNAAGHRDHEIRRYLDLSPSELMTVKRRVRQAAIRLDADRLDAASE